MRKSAFAAAVLGTLALGGCVTTETAKFQPAPGQQAIIRDGQPAIVSKKATSVVLVRPASREFRAGSRPTFVVGIYNPTGQPQNFLMSNVSVAQAKAGKPPKTLKVYTYEELAKEERNRQIAAAIFVGIAAGANAYSASQAGHYHSNSTVYTPYGTARVHTTGYSPAAAAIAQSNAAAQNAAMMDAAIENGQRNLAVLEQAAIKDNTLMPGEWYGGQLQFDAPIGQTGEAKTYRISVTLGSDVHQIDVVQGANGA